MIIDDEIKSAIHAATIGDLADAKHRLTTIFRTIPDARPWVLDVCARIHIAQGRVDRAESCWLAAVAINPTMRRCGLALIECARQRQHQDLRNLWKFLIGTILVAFLMGFIYGVLLGPSIGNLWYWLTSSVSVISTNPTSRATPSYQPSIPITP